MQISAPTHCPSCGKSETLEFVNDRLYCRNKQCPAQASKGLEHFVKTAKIKGFGPATLAKLDLTNIPDLLSLSEEYMISVLGEVIGKKLFIELQNFKSTASLNVVLPALGIPLIGNTATQKLALVINSIDEITKDSCAKAGLGPKATSSLIDWLTYNYEEVEQLDLNLTFSTITEIQSDIVICITGKLTSFKTKELAKAALEAKGIKVKTSLTTDVTHLVNESNKETEKTATARARGVIIINNLNIFLGEIQT